jgi:hypothetical protein
MWSRQTREAAAPGGVLLFSRRSESRGAESQPSAAASVHPPCPAGRSTPCP